MLLDNCDTTELGKGGTERKNGKKVIVLTICQMLPFYDYVFPTKNSFMYPNSLIRTHKKVLSSILGKQVV